MASRSLGVLTLDLIAKIGGFETGLDKAGRNARKNSKTISVAMTAVGNIVADVAEQAAESLKKLVIETATAGAEISRLASLSGTTTDSFQKYAAGAKFIGVEQEKLADTFKDINDRIGDFLQTGGGPLVDFFEQVAPKVGVTASQFAKLSGPDALQLYVSSLEKANVSQNDMTFYLEAVSSNLTFLLPLLRNGGKGFKELGDLASAAGAIIDKDTIRASSELTASFKLLDLGTEGLKNQVSSNLLPVLADLANQFFNVSEKGGLAVSISDFLESSLKGLIATAVGAVTAFKLLGTGLGALGAAVATGSLDPLREAVIDLSSEAAEAAEAIESIFEAGEQGRNGQTNIRIQTLVDLLEQSKKAIEGSGEALSKIQRDAFVDITKNIAALELQAQVVGKSKDEAELYKAQIAGATDLQLMHIFGLQQTIAEGETQKKLQEDYNKLVKALLTDEEKSKQVLEDRLDILKNIQGVGELERERLTSAAIDQAFETTPELESEVSPASEFQKFDEAQTELEDWYATQLQLLNTFRQNRSDLDTEWNEKELELKTEHDKVLANIDAARRDTQLAVAEETFGKLAGIAKTFGGEESKAYKALFLAEKAVSIQRSIVAIQAAFAQAASLGFPANIPATLQVASLTAGIVSTIQGANVSGSAQAGIDSIPEDGTWFLHRNERVVASETSAKLDSTLENVQRSLDRPSQYLSSQNLRIVNAFDTSVISDYLGSDEGEQTIINVARNNRGIYQNISGGGF